MRIAAAGSSWISHAISTWPVAQDIACLMAGSLLGSTRTSSPRFAGELSSDDDFYMLDSGLVVLQTTNDILNASLYTALDHRTVVSWQRVSLLVGFLGSVVSAVPVIAYSD